MFYSIHYYTVLYKVIYYIFCSLFIIIIIHSFFVIIIVLSIVVSRRECVSIKKNYHHQYIIIIINKNYNTKIECSKQRPFSLYYILLEVTMNFLSYPFVITSNLNWLFMLICKWSNKFCLIYVPLKNFK